MTYPALSLDAAGKLYTLRRAGEETPSARHLTVYKTGVDFDEGSAIDFLNQCSDLAVDARDTGLSSAEFDSQCAPLLHSRLRLPTRIAGDADFWRWLTFAHGCHGAEVVDWRYRPRSAGDGEQRAARRVYYGLEAMKKGMFAKLWICANMMFVEGADDPYDGIEYADVDLWDSHVIDIDYGSSPVMARAFVKAVRGMKLPRGEPNDPDGPAGFRDLAKEIRRRHATVAIELFDDAEAREWVEEVWDERRLWSGKP